MEPDFEKIIAQIFKAEAENLARVIKKEVKDKSKDLITKVQIKCKAAFKKYLEKSYSKYSRIKTLLYKTEPQYIYDFFECNNIKYKDKNIDPSNIYNLLEISNFLIIEGTGGIGKSTLMKHLFINAMENKKHIPIFFELKNLNNVEDNLEKCIYNSLKNLGCDLEEKYFEYAMKSGMFVLILDGYDEIANLKINKFYNELEELCDKYDKNFYIISSRPSQNFIGFQRFTLLETCIFSKEKAINLIKKIKYDEEIKQRFIKALDEELYYKHQSFASNPLLLTIMLMTYSDYADIPNKLHIFYAQAFETLYTKHDATKSGYKREMKSKLTKDEFVKIFSTFCFFSYMKEKIEFSKLDLEELFKKVKKQKLEFNNEDFLEDLISSICLMYKDGKVYTFVHRSFQEYFTAKFIIDLPDEQQRKICFKLIKNRQFDNVLDMLMDMSKERFEKNILIPYLEEIENKCENGNRYETYLKELFGFIRIFKREKIHRPNQENKTFINFSINNSFLYNVILHYDSIINRSEFKNTIDIKERDEILLNILEERETMSIKMDEVLKNEKLCKIIEGSRTVYYRMKCIMGLLDKLKASYNDRDEEIEELLKD